MRTSQPAGSTKPMRSMSQSARAVAGRAVAVDADQQPVQVEAEVTVRRSGPCIAIAIVPRSFWQA